MFSREVSNVVREAASLLATWACISAVAVAVWVIVKWLTA